MPDNDLLGIAYLLVFFCAAMLIIGYGGYKWETGRSSFAALVLSIKWILNFILVLFMLMSCFVSIFGCIHALFKWDMLLFGKFAGLGISALLVAYVDSRYNITSLSARDCNHPGSYKLYTP